MSLMDDIELGKLVDEIDADTPQTDLNEYLLYEHDCKTLLKNIPNRISKYELAFLFEKVNENDVELWSKVLLSMAKYYKLHYLKMIVENSEILENYGNEVKKALAFLKINMIELILEKKIDMSFNRDQMEDYLLEIRAPTYFFEGVKYIDGDSYIYFMNKLFSEVEEPYTDI